MNPSGTLFVRRERSLGLNHSSGLRKTKARAFENEEIGYSAEPFGFAGVDESGTSL